MQQIHDSDRLKPISAIPIGFAFLAVILRLLQSLPLDMLSGTNGMYYPVMIRGLLRDGRLPFADAPGVFYLVAGITRITGVSSITALQLLNILIPPTAIFPLAWLWCEWRNHDGELTLRSLLPLAFGTFAFGTMVFAGDLIKNGVAIPFAATCLVSIVCYRHRPDRMRLLVVAALSGVIVALMHFGTCAVVLPIILCYTFLPLGQEKEESESATEQASSANHAGTPNRSHRLVTILVLIGSLMMSIAIIGLSDASRLRRLFLLTGELFERPLALSGRITPTYIIGLIGTAILSWASAKRRFRSWLGFLIPQYLLLFPFFDGEYLNRFMLVLALPQAIHAITLLAPCTRYEDRADRVLLKYLGFAAILGPVLILTGPDEFALDEAQRSEILEIKPYLDNGPEDVIIVAHHGLEWWVSWLLDVDVAKPGAWDPSLLKSYDGAYSLLSIELAKLNSSSQGPRPPPESRTNKTGGFPEIRRPGSDAPFPQLFPAPTVGPVYEGRFYTLYPL